jgi:proteasome lid subunit RPN8/RPN11
VCRRWYGHGDDRRGSLTAGGTTGASFRVRAEALSAIANHAREEFPNECCGLLVGTADLIDEAVPARNVLASPSRYQIDPRDHIAANRRLRGTGRGVLGAYHSHPRTPAIPSPADLAEAQYPEFLWLIVSLADGALDYRAYRIAAAEALALEILIAP